MSANEELHARLREFLIAEVNRRDERQCVRIELFYAPKGAREVPLKDWTRKEAPEIFESLTLIEKVTTTIIEAAEHYADSFMSGRHRFVVITKQHLGGTAQCAFVMAAGAATGEDTAIAAPATTALATSSDVLTQNNLALMRTNQMMFEGTVRTLSATNSDLREENTELRTRVRQLEQELDHARSDRFEREAAVHIQGVKAAQRAEAINKFLSFATIAISQYINKGSAGKAATPKEARLKMLMSQLAKSLRDEQIRGVFDQLNQAQQALLMEIMTIATEPDEEEGSGNGNGGAAAPAA